MSKHGSALLSVGLGAAILYLGAQAVTGRQGLVAYVDLQAQERVLDQRLEQLADEEAQLQARAARLQPGEHFDRDYLDERARITLAAGDSDEIVFDLN
ncbi:MAG: septum formation initiator family protein [Caulobacteraceae bacterium]|nr:septum formation initiator family protein [Caulobacteraceae bacterium]MBP6689423.1 septum formation initiator family protein [Hyphomonadaceae bacterium]